MQFDDLMNQKVVIWGAGREGLSAFKQLASRGIPASIAVTDVMVDPEIANPNVVYGPQAELALDSADVVLKSPGIPQTSPRFIELRTAGKKLTSLMDLWLTENCDKVIAVTGTKGKSTTAAIINHILSCLGYDSRLMGNVGIPVEGTLSSKQTAVVEVSSYQAASISHSPRLAVLTSLFPEHLPWHGSYDQYCRDKMNLISHNPNCVVLPSNDEHLVSYAKSFFTPDVTALTPKDLMIDTTANSISWRDVGNLNCDSLSLAGIHNYANAGLALTAAAFWCQLSSSFDRRRALNSLRSFRPLEHRLQVVPSSDERTWIDDSLATNPQAVVAALKAYQNFPITLILGGADRGLSLTPLIKYFRESNPGAPVQVFCTGPLGRRFAQEFGKTPPRIEVKIAACFRNALDLARTHSHPQAIVLLSPGAPSFDEFKDYRAKSSAFKTYALIQQN